MSMAMYVPDSDNPNASGYHPFFKHSKKISHEELAGCFQNALFYREENRENLWLLIGGRNDVFRVEQRTEEPWLNNFKPNPNCIHSNPARCHSIESGNSSKARTVSLLNIAEEEDSESESMGSRAPSPASESGSEGSETDSVESDEPSRSMSTSPAESDAEDEEIDEELGLVLAAEAAKQIEREKMRIVLRTDSVSRDRLRSPFQNKSTN
jgi:hypothetical protein